VANGESKVITYHVSKDGQSVEVDGKGFHGSECLDVAKTTLAAIGEVVEEKHKPSFFETAPVHTRM